MSDDEQSGDALSPEGEPGSQPEAELTPEATPEGAVVSAPAEPAPRFAPPPPPPHGPYAGPPTGYPPPPVGWGPPPAYRPAPRHRSSVSWIVLLVVVLGISAVVVGSVLVSSGEEGPSLTTLSRVGVISIDGIIRDGGRGGIFSGSDGSRETMRQIREAKKDSETKAVLLLINSPGGSPAASHAIWQEIMKLKTRKKVVVCMTDVCASGGYYIASAADKIVAQGSTMTGSIGVIMGGMGYSGLMKKLGLTDDTLTAGKYKDAGSGQRPMTPEEKAYLKAMLADVYGQFIAAVAEGRKMDPAKVRRLAEGRIYTGKQAQAVGLVDELGNFYDAVKLAGKLADIKGDPRLKYYGESRSLLSELTGTESLLRRLFSARSPLDDMALQGPMLVLPYTYQMVPLVRGEMFDLK